MKKILIALTLLLFSAGLVFATEPVEGLWKSVDEKTGEVTGVWRIYVKDGKLFGEMLICVGWANDCAADACKDTYPGFPKKGRVSHMPLVGTPFIYNLYEKSENYWKGGYIIDPGDGKYYYCKITFCKADGKKYKEDMLKMRGEIGLGIGRNQWWVRSSYDEVKELTKKNKFDPKYTKATD